MGGGTEVCTRGSAGAVGRYSASRGKAGLPRLSGTGTLRASAMAAAREEALGKRAAGSLARQRKMTSSSAGGMFGLMSTGEGGAVWRWWDITAAGLSP